MRQIERSGQFKSDFKLLLKQYPRKKYSALYTRIEFTIFQLAEDIALPEEFRDHQLTGQLKEFRDCHILNDLVLLYKKTNRGEIRILRLYRLGSHAHLNF